MLHAAASSHGRPLAVRHWGGCGRACWLRARIILAPLYLKWSARKGRLRHARRAGVHLHCCRRAGVLVTGLFYAQMRP